MPHPNRISLSLAGTAAVALTSLPFGITPANAARVSEGTTSSIGVIEASSNAQQFNLGSLGSQFASTGLVATAAPSRTPVVGGIYLPGFVNRWVVKFLGCITRGFDLNFCL